MTEIELNKDQAIAILTEGMQRGLYENGGAIPQEEEVLFKDASELVKAAKAAFNNGNRSDNVQTILFISDVDQKPIIKENETPAETAPEVESSTVHNGIDLSTLSDGVIEGLITGLDKYPPSEQVEEDRKAYLAEKERRNEKGSQIQDDSQGTTAQAAPEKAREATPEGSHPQSAMDDQISPEAGADGGSGEVPELSAAQGEDAGAFARAQTPETSPEGKRSKAKAQKEDGSRAELEQQLTLSIIKAYKADISKLDEISVEHIEYMLENPDGPPNNEEKKVAISESEIEAERVPKDKKSVSGINGEVIAPVREITKADLGLGEVEEEEPTLSEEREKLEALVTGPMLKAYGRGRKQIPSIGDNELRFMILHPDGKVDPSDLEKAKGLDGAPVSLEPKMVVTKEVPGPEQVNHFLSEKLADPVKVSEEKDRTIAEAAKEVVIKSPPVEEASNKWDVKTHNIGEDFNILASPGQNRAMEIISRENFPIPPAYSDEEAPVFPMDVSIISRDELFSLHAKFHAYEIRMNYVLMEHEDLMNDCIKLREYREAEVAKAVPFMGEDGRRNTNEHREAQVKGDKEVLELGMKEHEARKIVVDLKVFRNGYHLDCERLSRQMSKYETERSDAPR